MKGPVRYVYCLTMPPFLKIGGTRQKPRRRLAQLQTGNPHTLYLLAYDTTMTEEEAHRLFEPHRVDRTKEWFHLHEDIMRAMQSWGWRDEYWWRVHMAMVGRAKKKKGEREK
jgi:hypothetical protein